jgi:hypothetical protein
MYTKNELLFPYEVTPALQESRGEGWQQLVARAIADGENSEAGLAFVLLMVRLGGCLSCETDSFRAMRGCEACALQTVRRYKGSDAELQRQYAQACDDLRAYLAAQGQGV